jgi:hypothetical protein
MLNVHLARWHLLLSAMRTTLYMAHLTAALPVYYTACGTTCPHHAHCGFLLQGAWHFTAKATTTLAAA